MAATQPFPATTLHSPLRDNEMPDVPRPAFLLWHEEELSDNSAQIDAFLKVPVLES
jgi:hypothetical protein